MTFEPSDHGGSGEGQRDIGDAGTHPFTIQPRQPGHPSIALKEPSSGETSEEETSETN